MDAFHHLADLLLSRLVWTSLQATLLIGVVALIVRWLPRLSASIRCTLWWLVSLQLVLGLCWQAPLELPLLAPVAATAPVDLDAGRVAPSIDTAPVTRIRHHAAPVTSGIAAMQWQEWLPALWLLAMLAQLPLLLRQSLRARRLLRTASPLTDASLQALCAQRARAIGLRRCPPLYVCADITSPQVSGLRHPVVLLPTAHTMTAAESAMAMAHELAHLRRGDLWLGWLPAIARRLFFFHPLVAWAMREYAFEREAACDAQVLQQTGTPAHAYARLLLRLGVAHPLHAGLAGASPTFLNLKRRLNMLQQTDVASPRHLRGWLLVALIAAAGIVPYRVTAGSSAHADTASHAAARASVTPPAPPTAPIPPAPPAPAIPVPGAPMPPPAMPAPPAPPPPPTQINGFSAHHVDIDTTDHAANGFALIGANSVTINGSNDDLETIKRLRKTKEPLLWFRRGDAAYIIRDKNLLARANSIYAPVTELARAQGRLAGQQGSLAGQQAGLAERDASLAREQAGLARRQAQLATEVAATAGSVDGRPAADARRAALDARQREMDSAQARLEQRHAAMEPELASQRTALETRQAEIEKQQEQLEQQQQRAAPAAEQAMSQLLDEAIAKGLAQRTSPR